MSQEERDEPGGDERARTWVCCVMTYDGTWTWRASITVRGSWIVTSFVSLQTAVETSAAIAEPSASASQRPLLWLHGGCDGGSIVTSFVSLHGEAKPSAESRCETVKN